MKNSDKLFLLGIFSDDAHLMAATKALKNYSIPIYDIYTPFPVHGLDDLMDIKRSHLPIVCFVGCVIGLLVACYFQIWTSAVSWPLNVGGKPFNSFVAFIPVAFEITVLLGAILTVVAFFYTCGFYPGKKSDQPHIGITDHSFVIAIECTNAAINTKLVKNIFDEFGAVEIIAPGALE